MKCLNCGRETNDYLCGNCRTESILDDVFHKVLLYKPDDCPNPYIVEYVSTMTEKYEERNCIPKILELFDDKAVEYYYCRYYKICKDPRFEETAKHFLANHPWENFYAQKVMHSLLDFYLRDDFIQPRKWCDWIAATDDLYCDLYAIAGQYYGMIGEYDAADAVLDKALSYCSDEAYDRFLFSVREKAAERLEKQKKDILRYRTKKPYWPLTEERRRAVAMFYDEKGIQYPRIESRPAKVPENEFTPIRECFDDELTDYCTFWCSETFSLVAAKCIYQIAAVRIRNGCIEDEFQSLIRPWDGIACRKDAARKTNLELSVIESAEDVDLVMQKFFSFVGSDVLASTEALGNQAKLISRAARYSGMKEIPNAFYDLLDLAADTAPEFDMENNTRAYLLSHFGMEEGADALEKARINKALFDALKMYGE